MTDGDALAADDRTPNIHGFDDSGAADAGFEIAEPLAFRSDADPDATERQARLPVYKTVLYYYTNKNGHRVVAQGDDRAMFTTIAPRRSDQSRQWMGLSLMRRGAHDVRPVLLALVRYQAGGNLEQVIGYGANYVRAWAAMGGRTYAADVLAAAAADALAIVVAGRESRAPRKNPKQPHPVCRLRQPVRVSAASRAKELRMDTSTYGALRLVALQGYMRRLKEAEARFTVVDDYRPLASGRHFGNAFAREGQWIKPRTTAELCDHAAQLWHTRKPTQCPFDWAHYNR